MTSIQYRHENVREESNIWQSPYTVGWFRWSNVCGEGEAPSFEDAVREAEEALTPCVEVANNGKQGDHRIVIWRNPVTGVRYAETNGDPIWEESDTEAFREVLAECGIQSNDL